MGETTRGPGEARSPGRPVGRVLTPDRIVREALVLLEKSGDAGFTVTALARALGVAPSALYNHVTNKRELLILVQDHVIGQIDHRCFDELPWAEAVGVWARSMRKAFAAHPTLVPIYAVMSVTDSRVVLDMYETVTRGFLAAGWSDTDVLQAIVSVESFVLGSAMDAVAPEDVFDTGAMAEDFPLVARAGVAARGDHAGARAEAAFELGLASLFDGLDARR